MITIRSQGILRDSPYYIIEFRTLQNWTREKKVSEIPIMGRFVGLLR